MRQNERNLKEYCQVCGKITDQRIRYCPNLDGTETLVQYCAACLFDKVDADKYFASGKYNGEGRI